MMNILGNYENLNINSNSIKSNRAEKKTNNFHDMLSSQMKEANQDKLALSGNYSASNSSDKVTDAWNKAVEETGIDPSDMRRNKKIPEYYGWLADHGITLSSYNITGMNFLGDSINSALAVATGTLERLNNPHTRAFRNPENLEFEEKEKEFYRNFIKNLEEK